MPVTGRLFKITRLEPFVASYLAEPARPHPSTFVPLARACVQRGASRSCRPTRSTRRPPTRPPSRRWRCAHATLLGHQAIVATCLLELDEALVHAESAEEAARLQRLAHLEHFALWVRALVHEQRGELGEVERAVRDSARLVGRLEPSKLTRTAGCDLAALGPAGDPERAIGDMTAAAGPDLEHADPTRHRRPGRGRALEKQVAATLFLSEKTVENALTRVYAKLGVRSRTQLARTLA